MVLLQPPQESIVQIGGSMLRKWDPSAPSSELTEGQRRIICQDPRILELRRSKREVIEEMQSLASTKKKAKDSFPHLYQQHKSLSKELHQLRKTLAKKTKKTIRKDYFYNAPILEVDKQVNEFLGQANSKDHDADSDRDHPDYTI